MTRPQNGEAPQGTSLKILPTGDPNTAFHHQSPRDILDAYGHPRYLLSSSAKTKKCVKVNVLTRVLYVTSGVLCVFATEACLKHCLGHTSGRMHMPDCYRARDQRAALYFEHPELFIKRLNAEIALHEADAMRRQLMPAVRINGTSDWPWEVRHPEIFTIADGTQFFDYTKVPSRMRRFLAGQLPANYYLTFSADGTNDDEACCFLHAGGTAAVVFWPDLPRTWWGFPVTDGDVHDARFLDPRGVIVGLRAKGIARVELDGFVVRPCPVCRQDGRALALVETRDDSHRHTLHACSKCGYQLAARWILTPLRQKAALKPNATKTSDLRQLSFTSAA